MRDYSDVIDVTTRGGEPSTRIPTFFVWRGRRYRVTAVLENWYEVMPWWRAAVITEEDATTTHALERRVWRVEAAPGQLTTRGVFEIADSGSGWFLDRLSD